MVYVSSQPSVTSAAGLELRLERTNLSSDPELVVIRQFLDLTGSGTLTTLNISTPPSTDNRACVHVTGTHLPSTPLPWGPESRILSSRWET